MSDNETGRYTSDTDWYTRSYECDPDDWSLDDPRHGFNVPDSIRRGGAINPQEREEIGENGVSLRSHSVYFECEDCGEIRRFATDSFVTQHWCHTCEDVDWFRFDWDLNRPLRTDTKQKGGVRHE